MFAHYKRTLQHSNVKWNVCFALCCYYSKKHRRNIFTRGNILVDNIAEAKESDSGGFTYLLAILFPFLPFV